MARPQINDDTMHKLDSVVRDEYDLDPAMLTTDDKVALVLKQLDDSDESTEESTGSTGKRTGSTPPASSPQRTKVDLSDHKKL